MPSSGVDAAIVILLFLFRARADRLDQIRRIRLPIEIAQIVKPDISKSGVDQLAGGERRLRSVHAVDDYPIIDAKAEAAKNRIQLRGPVEKSQQVVVRLWR